MSILLLCSLSKNNSQKKNCHIHERHSSSFPVLRAHSCYINSPISRHFQLGFMESMFFNYQLSPFPVYNYVLSTLITIQRIIKYFSEEYFADISAENTGTYKPIRQLFYFSFFQILSYIKLIKFPIFPLYLFKSTCYIST